MLNSWQCNTKCLRRASTWREEEQSELMQPTTLALSVQKQIFESLSCDPQISTAIIIGNNSSNVKFWHHPASFQEAGHAPKLHWLPRIAPKPQDPAASVNRHFAIRVFLCLKTCQSLYLLRKLSQTRKSPFSCLVRRIWWSGRTIPLVANDRRCEKTLPICIMQQANTNSPNNDWTCFYKKPDIIPRSVFNLSCGKLNIISTLSIYIPKNDNLVTGPSVFRATAKPRIDSGIENLHRPGPLEATNRKSSK